MASRIAMTASPFQIDRPHIAIRTSLWPASMPVISTRATSLPDRGAVTRRMALRPASSTLPCTA
jgi:hypothetical protein